jgi:hypothetical protein
MVQSQPGNILQETSIFKITRAKWTGSVAQALECLLCKLKALNSNSSLTKKTKKSLLGTFPRHTVERKKRKVCKTM